MLIVDRFLERSSTKTLSGPIMAKTASISAKIPIADRALVEELAHKSGLTISAWVAHLIVVALAQEHGPVAAEVDLVGLTQELADRVATLEQRLKNTDRRCEQAYQRVAALEQWR
jgi:hypothetical protein